MASCLRHSFRIPTTLLAAPGQPSQTPRCCPEVSDQSACLGQTSWKWVCPLGTNVGRLGRGPVYRSFATSMAKVLFQPQS